MKIGLLTAVLLLRVGTLPAQVPVQRGLVLTNDNTSFPFPLDGRMRWTGNRLSGCDYCTGKHPILWTVHRQGNRMAVGFDLPEAGYTVVRDVASGPDGSLMAVGLAISGDSQMGTFMAWISPNGVSQVITRVWPYSPNAVTVAPDGTVWTIGAIMNANYRVVDPNVLRHYTTSGQLLGSTIVRNIRKSKGDVYTVSGNSTLLVSRDRVGWLTATCQYVEFSFDGVQLGSYVCPGQYTKISDVAGTALSSENDVLIGGKRLAPLAPLELDRKTGVWHPVAVHKDEGTTRRLLGFDGLTLVTSPVGSSSMRRYDWSGRSAAGGQ